MIKLVPGVTVLAALLVAATAEALPSGTPYSVTIGGAPAGVLTFELDADVEGACRYLAQWETGQGVPGEQCYVDERNTLGRGSCTRNASMPVATIVTVAVGEECGALDSSGQSAIVYDLVLSERRTDGVLNGIIQLDSASTAVHAFHAAPLN